jgi:hypothetical protein
MRQVSRWTGTERLTLLSPFSVEDSVARLKEQVGSEWNPFGRSAVVGRVGQSSFSIRKRLRFGSSNSFQTWLSGKIVSDRHGARIDCRLGMSRAVIAMIPIILIMIWFVCSSIVGEDIAAVRRGETPIYFAIPLFFTVFLVGLILVGRYAARKEGALLIAFMRETIDAQEQNSDRAAAIEAVWRRGAR